jgi:Rps23 Pro-64 3,4-dihydroxylase Tpa1-like proline 4-hydroxylase
MSELAFLTGGEKLKPPEETGSATDANEYTETKGVELKKCNKALFLDECYSKREVSDILTLTEKFLADKKVRKAADKKSWFYGILPNTNYDTTLLSYYENKDYYESHFDVAIITLLFWFNKQPKGFDGGDLVLPEIDTKIPFQHNTVVMLPSFVQHQVESISMKKKNGVKDNGRYCVSKFLTIR